MPPGPRLSAAARERATTRRFALDRAEVATTALAAAASTAAYLSGGGAYLARGVVGDLVGFVGLAAAGLVARRRVRHEALVCLAAIGGVVALDPSWPLRLPEPAWWAVFVVGLAAYLRVRQHVCD